MAFEAARVRRDDQGKELAEYPQNFVDLVEALEYVRDTPVSNDSVRPWIRNLSSPRMLGSFLMVGGRLLQPRVDLAHCSTVRRVLCPSPIRPHRPSIRQRSTSTTGT